VPVRVLVVVPTYQEVENIEEMLRRVRRAVPEADVLVVDDASPDGTADAAEKFGQELERVEVLRRGAKSGLGSAYRAGFGRGLAQGYDVLVQMDADLSHDPAAIPSLLGALDQADLAVGSRYVAGGSIPHWPARRRALSRYGNRYATAVLGLGIRDATSGFRAYKAQTLRTIDVEHTTATGYGFQVELAYRAAMRGCKLVEVPIVFVDRVRGTSKMSSRIIAEAMWSVTVWGLRDRLRRTRPGDATTTSA
jgi:dolichol-phosphate mannosyltransferase